MDVQIELGNGDMAHSCPAQERMPLEERLDRLTKVARAVLGAACFARVQEWCDGDTRQLWLARIDVLRARRKGHEEFHDVDVASLGLERIRLDASGMPSLVPNCVD